MKVQGIDHATIRTPRLDETRAFFEHVLGLRVGPAPAFGHPVCWLYAGDRDVVHIVGVEHAQTPSQAAAINHFALRIADYDEAVAELKRSGVAYETDTTPGGELRQIYLTDPNGVRVELNCPGEGQGG